MMDTGKVLKGNATKKCEEQMPEIQQGKYWLKDKLRRAMREQMRKTSAKY